MVEPNKLLDSSGRLLARSVPRTQMKFVADAPLPELARAVVEEKLPEGEQSFVVDKILKHCGLEGAQQYLVRWGGCTEDQDTWEPETNFDDHHVIQKYWDAQ